MWYLQICPMIFDITAEIYNLVSMWKSKLELYNEIQAKEAKLVHHFQVQEIYIRSHVIAAVWMLDYNREDLLSTSLWYKAWVNNSQSTLPSSIVEEIWWEEGVMYIALNSLGNGQDNNLIVWILTTGLPPPLFMDSVSIHTGTWWFW